jgi:hypothetical protein
MYTDVGMSSLKKLRDVGAQMMAQLVEALRY